MKEQQTITVKIDVPAEVIEGRAIYEELEGKRARTKLDSKALEAYVKTYRAALDADEEIQARLHKREEKPIKPTKAAAA